MRNKILEEKQIPAIKEGGKLEIYDSISGRLQISALLPGSENFLDVSSLNQGIYVVHLNDGEKIIFREKIVKIN